MPGLAVNSRGGTFVIDLPKGSMPASPEWLIEAADG
jgi:hypothetical protein